jgi:hypothetical protein
MKPVSLPLQFSVVMGLETTNDEQAHLRRKVRGKERNNGTEQREKKTIKIALEIETNGGETINK